MNTTKGKGDPTERRSGLSCAECRRSKLKCDRVFPCQSCIRRNCAAICPDGTLAATKRNRVLMEHAQKLTDQVKSMSSKIRDLELALAQSQLQIGEVHPLLQSTNKVENIPDVETIWDSGPQDGSDAAGSTSINLEGQAIYHGETSTSVYLKDVLALEEEEQWRSRPRRDHNIPLEIVDLKNAFPFGLRDCPYTKLLFVQFLPSRARALQIADLYYIHVAWMYDPIVRDEFMNKIINVIYGSTGLPSLDLIHSHKLSVFFSLLAAGTMYDCTPSAKDFAEEYHLLSRAALSLDPVLHEATCATVQALLMILRFIYTFDRTANEARWLLVGLCCRVAQTVGLQRDSGNWNLQPDEVQRRRNLFWELFTYDAWTSIVNGRPTAFSLTHTNCHFPDDLDYVMTPSGERELGFHAWKFRYSASCLSLSVQQLFLAKIPPYSTVLDIDTKIRKFPVPAYLQSPSPTSEATCKWSSDPALAMQQYSTIAGRESNLLYIHRSYFAQAIRQNSENPLKHAYTPSVLATYRSACRMTSSLKSLCEIHPVVAGRVWFFWSGIFSACMVLGALVVESPGCSLAQNALQELDQAVALYDEGSRSCRPPSSLIVLQRLLSRAYNTLTTYQADVVKNNPHKANNPDNLEALGGKQVVNASTESNSPGSNGSGSNGSGSVPSQQWADQTASEDCAKSNLDTGGTYYDHLCDAGYDQSRDYVGSGSSVSLPSIQEGAGYIPPPAERFPADSTTNPQMIHNLYMTTPSTSLQQSRPLGPSYMQPPGYLQLPQHTASGPRRLQQHAGPPTEHNIGTPQIMSAEQFTMFEQNQDNEWGSFVRQLVES